MWKKRWWKGVGIFGVVVILLFLFTFPTLAWWDSDWEYRRPITIQSNASLTDYQVLIELNDTNFDFSKTNSDGSDIRFVDEDDATKLSYWIEEWDASSQSAKIWVNVTSIPAGEKTIYLYYNNSGAVSESDGDAVFEFFDDFEGGSLDTNKWTTHIVGSSNTVEVSGGAVILTVTDTEEDVQHVAIISNMNFGAGRTSSKGYAIDYKAKTEGSYAGSSPGYKSGCEYISSGSPVSSFDYVHKDNLMVYTNEDTDSFYLSKWVSDSETQFDSFSVSDVNGYTYTATAKILDGNVVVDINNGEHTLTSTDDTDISEGPITFFASGGSDRGEKLTVYYVRVRKYADPEPSMSVGAEELPPPPLLNISGYVFYANNTPCNNPTVNVTNLNNGMEWIAETSETNNYYYLVIYEGQANASEQLKFEVSSPDGKQTNTTYYTITDEDISAGNLTLNFTLTGDPEFVWRNLSVTPLNGLAPLTINATVEVENIGGSDGECNATFLINGVVVDWKIVSVAVGEVKNVSFTHTFEWDGSYDVTIDSLSAKTVVVQMHDVKINKSLEGSCDGIRIERNGSVVECYETLLADEVYHIKLQILNNGTFDDGVNVVVKVDSEVLYTDTKTLTAKTGVWNVDVEFDTSAWSSGDHIITATVSITGGASDAHPEDNTATRDITISIIVVSVMCEDETHIRVSIQHAHGSGFIYVGVKPQQYTYTFKHQGDGSYVLSTPFLQTNKTYYLKVCDERGCGEVLEFKITKEESLVEEEFGKEYKKLTESGDVLNISKLSNTIPSIYTTLLTDMFWAMFFGVIFLAYWIRQEDVMLPSIVGMISGVAMIGLLPPSAQHIAYILLVISIAGTLYTIIKARR